MGAWVGRVMLRGGAQAVVLVLAAASWLVCARGATDTGGEVRVRVVDAGTGKPMPGRLTIVDSGGKLAPIVPAKDPWLACRPGVLYTGTGEAAFSLPQGRYTLYANRGLEFSLVTRALEVGLRPQTLDLRLTREVDTRGYASCDTHIHTLTFSGHGDATIEERMATIAGEGLELAIATDHNHHTDYAPAARATQTAPFFTGVSGNEVTTRVGHFNIFPVPVAGPAPDYQSDDWRRLLSGMRAVPGVRVVVLNHPSDDHSGFIPDDPKRFHPASGESRDGRPWDFDGFEVVTSSALQSDLMRPYRSWFALLNRGHKMVGVGSSDSHDVNRFLLGQGRSYVACDDSNVDRISVKEACDSFLAGKVLVSMGLLTEAWVDGHGPGELVPPAPGGVPGGTMKVRVRVQGPRWIDADRIDLFADGEKILSRPIVPPKDSPVKLDATFTLQRPKHDAWLVAIATGPGITAPYWPTPRPYQPLQADWEPRVIGSTSPIRIDADASGAYTPPLGYAEALLSTHGASPAPLLVALGDCDSAVAVQAASLLRQKGIDLASAPWRRAIEDAAPQVRQAFVAYQRWLAP